MSPALAAEPAAAGDFQPALAEADRRFIDGDLAGALQILEPVCASSDHPDCAFALGAIQHGLGHCREALVHYRRYRQLAPAGAHRAEVDTALQEVEGQCGDAPRELAPAAPAAPTLPATSADAVVIPALPENVPAPSPAPARATGMAPPRPDPLHRNLMVGSFVLAGASAATSVVFGILAANSAERCRNSDVYDQRYIDECEHAGPSYQGLWQGFAIAAGAFAGVGATFWWIDANTSASVEVAGAGGALLQYRQRF